MENANMTTQDALWLTMDRPNNLMVIDGVMWFRTVPDWDVATEVVRERLVDRYPVLRCHPVQVDGRWEWQEDPGLDLDRHVKRVQLSGKGGPDELRKFVAARRIEPIDRDHPLWVIYFIENVVNADGSAGAAVLSRFHHSIADGIRLTQVFMGLCDLESEAAPTTVGQHLHRPSSASAVATSAVREVAGSVIDIAGATAHTGAHAAGSVADVARAAVHGDVGGTVSAASAVVSTSTNLFSRGVAVFKHPERLVDVSQWMSTTHNRLVNDVNAVGTLALTLPSVKTVWSGTPSVKKDVGWVPMLPLPQVKEIGHATGTTVNDVLLSTVAGALGRYLIAHGDSSVDEIVWLVPVSVKPISMEIDPNLGNHFAMVALRMPMGITDVSERLAQMHANMDRIKNSDEALLTFGIQRGISAAPDRIAAGVTNYFANKAVGVLTNVPGPRVPMRLAGTEVEGVLGWAPCSGDEPMTICILSYNDKVTVGFAADEKLVPDAGSLAGLLEDEFAAMYQQVVVDA
ncbi:MAG: WS/DGAT domain-containing protein, partial [Actinomycetes bacterium]